MWCNLSFIIWCHYSTEKGFSRSAQYKPSNEIKEQILMGKIHLEENEYLFCLEKPKDFLFNFQSKPHRGGMWEAAVKSSKYHLFWVGSWTHCFENRKRHYHRIQSQPVNVCQILLNIYFTAVPDSDVSEVPIKLLLLQSFKPSENSSGKYKTGIIGKWSRWEENLTVGDLVLVLKIYVF